MALAIRSCIWTGLAIVATGPAMIVTVGVREIVLGLRRGHIVAVDFLVGIWICIVGVVSGRGGAGVLDMAYGGFFGPCVCMKGICVNMSDDRRGGAGARGAWAMALGGAVSNCAR